MLGINKLHVFIVDSVGEHRGMHYYNFPLSSQLNNSGVEVTLISTPETITHPLMPADINAESFFKGIYGHRPKVIRGLNYAWALIKIFWLCIREKPNIIHFHFFQLPLLDLLLIYFINLTNSFTVTSIHDVIPLSKRIDFSSPESRIFKLIYRNSLGLVVQSQYSKEILLELDPALAEKVVVIPHANYSYFINRMKHLTHGQVKDAKIQIGLNPEDKVLLVFGTIKQNKRLDWVIRAMSLIYKRYPKLRLVIVGVPQDRDVSSDKRLADEMKLSDRVHWCTQKASDEELISYFMSADITLFPYERIYQSGAIIMAQNFAKPVIATSVGSNLEIIQDGKTGLLVKPNDPVSFANAISLLLDNSEKAAELGQAGLRYVTNELSWEKIAGKYSDYYLKLVTIK